MIGRLAESNVSRASAPRIARPTIATMMGLRSDSGFMAGRLICLPPSRALGLGPRLVVPEARQAAVREAGPRRRDTATAPGAASCRRRAGQRCAAFGPAPAARRHGLRLTVAVS